MSTDADFEAAFAQAVDSEPDAPVAEVETPAEPVAAVEPVQEPVAEAAPEVADVQPEEAAPAVEEAAPAPAPVAAAPVAPVVDTAAIAAALADEQERRQRQAAPVKQAEPEKPAAYSDYLDDSQKKALEQFNAEWPEVAAPVAALITAHVKAALANQQKEILGQVQQQMAPIQQATAQSQEALYFSTLQEKHPDYQQVAVALPQWIEKQPAFMRPALQAAYNSPSAADAVELISMYKQAIGSTGAAPAHPASSAVQAPPKAAPVAPAAVAATLAPPRAQRSVASQSRDPNDADAAFMEAFG